MLTANQEKEVIDYLISKRLSYDLASEIYDHMCDQIISFQNEGFSFIEAWEQVKVSWLSELKMGYDARFSLDDIAEISKKMMWERNKVLFPKLLAVSACLVAVTYGLISLLSPKDMWLVQVVFFVFYASVVVIVFREGRLYRKASRGIDPYKNLLTPYQNIVSLPLTMFGLLFIFFGTNHWKGLKLSVDQVMIDITSLSTKNVASLVGSSMLYMMFYFGCVFGLYAVYSGKKSLKIALGFKKRISDLEAQLSQ